jgi:oligopeptide transport system substrate-binding protein
MSSISRREAIALGAGGLVSCANPSSAYFGNTTLPRGRVLVHGLQGEPQTLDPALSTGSMEFFVIPALLEGLTQYHPHLPEPMAALATHYAASDDLTRFTFYLRGHPAPSGTRLPDSQSLPTEFTRGRKPVPVNAPALWSDGRPITAQDFVYSWRRLFDPRTAAPLAYQLYGVLHAEEINAGKRKAHELGVRALDDFTFEVILRSPTPFFLQLITQYIFNPVPRHIVEAARVAGNESSWTDPGRMVSSGPFVLKTYRRYEEITAVRNPLYYDDGQVEIDQLHFRQVVDGATMLNLYKSGDLTALPGVGFPSLFVPAVEHKRDFHPEPGFGTVIGVMNVNKPPLDNILLRYALGMAIDKKAFCKFLGGGRVPARNLVPPIPGYPAPTSLMVDIQGREYDILQFNVDAARSLLLKAGAGTPEITYHYAILPDTTQKAEMLQRQLFEHLGIRLKLAPHEFNEHWSMVLSAEYRGMADYAFLPLYFDPNPFLDPFVTPAAGNPTGWMDAAFATMLADANRTLDPLQRMQKLRGCEERMLRAMPLIPIYFDAWAYLCKPYVRGLTSNLFDTRAFKYAWIDRDWRAA